ncbi:germin-like protein subfamily 1 member 16 [Euphorbia lathyris]
MFCKDPEKVTVEDFSFSGFNIPRNTSEQLGVYVTLLDVSIIPGLNTNGISLARIDFSPNGGLNPPHTHPRAAEILTVLEGTVYAGFVGTNPDHRLFAKVLHPGDVIIFPFGLIHFQMNIGKTPAVAIAALTSQDPGVITIANAAFGSEPAMDPRVLAKAFHLDQHLVTKLQKEEWINPTY